MADFDPRKAVIDANGNFTPEFAAIWNALMAWPRYLLAELERAK